MAKILSQAQNIGVWTADAKFPIGTQYRDEANARTYIYVQVAATGNFYQGTPVGVVATDVAATWTVSTDADAVGAPFKPLGIITKTNNAAVTASYYGWVQMCVPGEILKSCCMDGGVVSAGTGLVDWINDGYFTTCAAFSTATTTYPIGFLMSGCTSDDFNTTWSAAGGGGDVFCTIGL